MESINFQGVCSAANFPLLHCERLLSLSVEDAYTTAGTTAGQTRAARLQDLCVLEVKDEPRAASSASGATRTAWRSSS